VLRSILVALDETPASQAAQQLAIGLARRWDCEITGLAVLDRAHIAGPTAVGIGGMAYKQHRDQVKLAEARAFLARLEQSFERSCEDLGSTWRVIEAEGAPLDLLRQEARRHDLLVLGKDTDFHLDEEPSIAAMVQALLRATPRPLLICPQSAPADGPVLVATDGSDRAARSLHMLALLGLAEARPVHVLAVAADGAAADSLADEAGALLHKHGLQVTCHGLQSGGPPSAAILAQAAALGATLIALGSSGHSAWQEFLLGSTTTDLLNACPCPLFVYH
jgi:nucleotide-binding universal stress UspA family protein